MIDWIVYIDEHNEKCILVKTSLDSLYATQKYFIEQEYYISNVIYADSGLVFIEMVKLTEQEKGF